MSTKQKRFLFAKYNSIIIEQDRAELPGRSNYQSLAFSLLLTVAPGELNRQAASFIE
jgi:hypothetical protein